MSLLHPPPSVGGEGSVLNRDKEAAVAEWTEKEDMKVQGVLIASILLLSCHIGQTLDCYSCDYGTCLIPSTTSCGLIQVCGTETATTGNLGLKKKGCLNPAECLTDSSVSYLGVTVTTTRSCCLSSLCNSATAPKVSVVTAVATMMALVLAKLF